MADTKREIERKYEATSRTGLPDLTRAAGVASVTDEGVTELDAVYYDTPDLRLAAHSLTLRRRTGGGDAGWHLKFPVAPGVRDEIRAPLSDTLPRSLAGLLRSRVRDGEVVPVVRLRTARDVRHLRADDGTLLAELSVDTVRAERLTGEGTTAWTEIEVELADDADPAILDAVEKRLGKAGITPSASASKLARALAGTGAEPEPPRPPPGNPAPPEPPSWPTYANRSTPSSSTTPPYAATCPTPCTSCASPAADCAAPSRPTDTSSTGRSPTPWARN